MYLNAFSDGLDPLDLTRSEEFQSLLESARELSIPHDPDIRYRSCNTVVCHQRFHFLEWGEPGNPQVVLLHGGNQSAHSWDLVSLHLAQRYHVIALDQRGHGDSEWNRGGDYSIEAMSADVELFAHSMGGMVALDLCQRRPESVCALGLVDVGPKLSEAGTRMIGEFVHKNVEFDDLEAFLDRVERYDPDTGAWIEEPPIPMAREEHRATYLGDGDGRLLVTGGRGATGNISDVSIFVPNP